MVDAVPREVCGSLHLLGHHPVSTLHLRGDKASVGLPRECSATCTPGSSGALGPLHPQFPCEHSALYIPGSSGALGRLHSQYPASTWPSIFPVPFKHCPPTLQVPDFFALHCLRKRTQISVRLESHTPEAIQRQ